MKSTANIDECIREPRKTAANMQSVGYGALRPKTIEEIGEEMAKREGVIPPSFSAQRKPRLRSGFFEMPIGGSPWLSAA